MRKRGICLFLILVFLIGILGENTQGVLAGQSESGRADAQQDVDVSTLPESLTTFLSSMTWYSDRQGGQFYDSTRAADGTSNIVAQIVKNGSCFWTNLYPVEVPEYHWGETTPKLLQIDPNANSYAMWSEDTVKWAATNIYNVSDADYETLVALAIAEHVFYKETVNGKTYFVRSIGGIGDNFKVASVVWARVEGTRYDVSYDVYSVWNVTPEYDYSCFAVLDLKTIDGTEYWSLVSHQEGEGPKTYMGTDAPELFAGIAGTYVHHSGIGAWYQELTIHEDGTFDGYYYDHDYAIDKPYDSEIYWSLYSGAFKNPRQINEYTWEFQVDYIYYYMDEGDELFTENEGYAAHYSFFEVGWPEGTTIRFVAKNAPIGRIDKEYVSWLPSWLDGSDGMHTPVDGLYGTNDKRGFYRTDAEPVDPEAILEQMGIAYEETLAIREIEVPFTDEITLDLRWGWELFDRDSSEYNHDLAMVGLTLSQAAETSKAACEERLQTLGFHEIDSVYYDRREQDMMFPAVTFGYQPITYRGQTMHVFVMVVRGTTNKGDIYTDLYSCFDGFVGARDNIKGEFRRFFESTVSKYELDLNDDNTIIFLTGHSLGGAMAGSMAYLMDAYAAQSKTFVYTYCSPLYETFSTPPESFPNVHNILNKYDTVPTVPPLKKHFGHEWWYSKNASTFDKGIFADHLCETILECMVEGLPSNMGPGAENHYRHSMIHCPVDIEVLDAETGERLGWTVGGEVFLNSDRIFIYTNGDEKNVVAREEDSNYTIRITGTGEGIMTYSDMIFDGEGIILEETLFENVVIEEGKVFEVGQVGNEGSGSEARVGLRVIDEEGKVLAEVQEDGTEVRTNPLARLFSGLQNSRNVTLVFIVGGALVFAIVLLIVIILLYKRSQKQ